MHLSIESLPQLVWCTASPYPSFHQEVFSPIMGATQSSTCNFRLLSFRRFPFPIYPSWGRFLPGSSLLLCMGLSLGRTKIAASKSNQRSSLSVCHPSLSYSPLAEGPRMLALVAGLEPATSGLQSRSSTNWATPAKKRWNQKLAALLELSAVQLIPFATGCLFCYLAAFPVLQRYVLAGQSLKVSRRKELLLRLSQN